MRAAGVRGRPWACGGARVLVVPRCRLSTAGGGAQHHVPGGPGDGDDDDEAQLAQYWRDLDRRVSNRRPRAVGPGTPTGRGPRRRSEVDYWLQAGLCADISHGGAAISSS